MEDQPEENSIIYPRADEGMGNSGKDMRGDERLIVLRRLRWKLDDRVRLATCSEKISVLSRTTPRFRTLEWKAKAGNDDDDDDDDDHDDDDDDDDDNDKDNNSNNVIHIRSFRIFQKRLFKATTTQRRSRGG